MTRFKPFRPSHTSPSSPRHLAWTSIGLSVVATTLCGAFLFAGPFSASYDLSSIPPGQDAQTAQLFGVDIGPAGQRKTKVLAGLGGEAFTPPSGSARAATAEAAPENIMANIKPAAWDRLSGGACMAVTTKSGQTFTFRVLGTRPAPAAKDGNAAHASVELAIAPCPDRGESIVKAVIMPSPDTSGKPVVAERSL